VQSSSPWQPQQQYLQDSFGQAQQNYQSGGPNFFGGNTYVPFAEQSQQALGMQEARALSGSNPENQLNQQLTGTLRGDYLNSNPYLDQMMNSASSGIREQFTDTVLPGINATFGAGGRTGGQLWGQTVADASGQLTDSLSRMGADIYGGNYQQERGRQLQAGAMVPGASALDYQNIDRLGGVGAAVEGKGREILGDQISRFNFYQNRPEQNLSTYQQLVGGNYGGEQSGYDKQSPWQTAGNVISSFVPFL